MNGYLSYFISEGLDKLLSVSLTDFKDKLAIEKSSNASIIPNHIESYIPDILDLARLHKLVRMRKCINVLEFGSGYSTIVIADALKKNSINPVSSDILKRRSEPWKVFSLEESKYWATKTRDRFPHYLSKFAEIIESDISIDDFNSRPATFYSKIPNIHPDLIYIDGPSQYGIGNLDKFGFNTDTVDRMPMSGDVLRLENFLLPGTLILFDGRTSNSRFILNNFQRKWKYRYSPRFDQTLLIQNEKPVGSDNRKLLNYLGPIKF